MSVAKCHTEKGIKLSSFKETVKMQMTLSFAEDIWRTNNLPTWRSEHAVSSQEIVQRTLLHRTLSDSNLLCDANNKTRCLFHQRLTCSFYSRRSQKCQMTLLTWLSLFAHSGSTCVKAVRRMLMKLTQACVNFTNILQETFFVQKFSVQLFCRCSLCLYFFAKRNCQKNCS